jgi:crossover junction endodeoxyribonuclease RuvC
MIIIGVDPGVSGALALFDEGKLQSVADMPVFEGRVDALELSALLQGAEIVYVENQHPMPRNGTIASFKLGMNYGVVLATIENLMIPIVRIPASTWKIWNGLRGKPKDASVQLARELWPNLRPEIRLAKHHNRAEAALIARYGWWKQLHERNADEDRGTDRHPAAVAGRRGGQADPAAPVEGGDQPGDQDQRGRVVAFEPSTRRS